MSAASEALQPVHRAQLRAAGIKIAIALLVCAGLFALYAHEVKVEQQVTDLLAGQKIAGGRAGGARAELNRDTPRGGLAAEDLLQQALALQPSNPWALGALADVEVLLTGAGLQDHASRAGEALARADAKDVEQPELFEAHTLQLIGAGRGGEAEAYLLALLQKHGAVPRMIDAMGRAQRASGKLPEARASFKRAQDADWRAPRFVADFAQAQLEDGANAEAVTSFDRALQANGDHVRSQLGKARALVALFRDGRAGGDLKLARSLSDGAVRQDLAALLKAQALATRAEVRLAEGDLEGAASDATSAQLAGPSLPAALRARALVLAARKKPEAGAAFKAAAAADPYDASLYFDGANALAAAGDPAAAEKLLAGFAATLPRTVRYHLAFAQVLARKDDLKAAQGELAKALKLEPTNAMVYFEEGRVAQRQKDTKGAVAAYERAAQLRDDYPEVYRQMGALYLENRDVEGAVRVFNEALARYKSARLPAQQLEAFYADVESQIARAGKKKLAVEWAKEARAVH